MHLSTKAFLISTFACFTAADSVCSSGIYSKLAVLSTYAPAQSYCSAHFPVATVTVTTTVTQLAKRTALDARDAAATKKHGANVSSCYSSLKGVASSIAKTLCSCIETTPTTTVTVTVTQSCVGSLPAAATGKTNGNVYSEFYKTTGSRESQTNPNNPNDFAGGERFEDGATCAEVLQYCADNADNLGDKSFNLFYTGDSNWECLTYPNVQTAANAADFDVADPSIKDSYGFSE